MMMVSRPEPLNYEDHSEELPEKAKALSMLNLEEDTNILKQGRSSS